jgi:3-oxoacyl-[acyl-carrier protein] reductase
MSGVAVITGGARNLGRAITLALAESGLDVVVNTRSELAAAAGVADEAAALGVRAVPVVADVADPDAVAELMDAAAELGPVRVLVCNASVRPRTPVAELDLAQWREVLSVTLDGAFHCVRAALPALRASGAGRVITVLGANSMAGDPTRMHVSAAKHGLLGLTRSLARAYPAEGLTANAVSPGKMNPPDPAEAERRRSRLAATVAFLASADAADVTGQLLTVGPTG